MRLIFLSLILVTLTCFASTDSKIVLQTQGFEDSTMIILSNSESAISDTGYIVKNELIFYVDISEPTRFSLQTDYKKREDFEHLSFWKEDNALLIQATKGALEDALISGSEIQKQVELLDLQQAPYQAIKDSLYQLYRSTPKKKEYRLEELRKQGNVYRDSLTKQKVVFIKEHPDYFYSAVLLNYGLYRFSKPQAEELYQLLSPQNKESKYAQDVRRYLDLSKDLSVGDKAIDFKLPSLSGDSISLSSLQGKYVLLDFWSSNCGACLIENPLLCKKYKQYEGCDFEILGYCLDKNKESWSSTVKKYKINWPTVSDLVGTNGNIPLMYDVFVMPTYFMIDKEGYIIGKVEGRRGLEAMIDGVFADSTL